MLANIRRLTDSRSAEDRLCCVRKGDCPYFGLPCAGAQERLPHCVQRAYRVLSTAFAVSVVRARRTLVGERASRAAWCTGFRILRVTELCRTAVARAPARVWPSAAVRPGIGHQPRGHCERVAGNPGGHTSADHSESRGVVHSGERQVSGVQPTPRRQSRTYLGCVGRRRGALVR